MVNTTTNTSTNNNNNNNNFKKSQRWIKIICCYIAEWSAGNRSINGEITLCTESFLFRRRGNEKKIEREVEERHKDRYRDGQRKRKVS